VSEPQYKEIGARLRELRGKRFTIGRIAKWADMHRQHVWGAEVGKRNPPDRLLIVYVDRCGGSMDELVRLRASKGE